MVESIARVEWIRINVFDIGGSSTRSEGPGKHLKRRKREGYKPRIFVTLKVSNNSGAKGLERTTS